MTDANSSGSKHSGTKPRLSLSKQSVVRLKSEDTQTSLTNVDPKYCGGLNMPTESIMTVKQETSSKNNEQELAKRFNGNTQTPEDNKMNISREDLIRLLSMLKSELQSKEVAIAALKCEQLKRLINPVEISRSSLANTYIKLQDRLIRRDKNNNADKSTTKTKNNLVKQEDRSRAERNKSCPNQGFEDGDLENLNILNTLLELLDRHPLLALPRDSIYCLDYNCSELSTKNYLNLKIQHLDNLINQHRRYRYYMSERLKRCEQRLLDVSKELEQERNSKTEIENLNFKTGGRVTLLKHISQLKDALEKEKNDKHAIVMNLLNELLDAKEQIDTLTKELKRSKTEGSLSSENDKSSCIKSSKDVQCGVQTEEESVDSSTKSSELQAKVAELEEENKALKLKLEQQEWRLAAVMKPEKIPPITKGSTLSGSSSSPNKFNATNRNTAIGSRMRSSSATQQVIKPKVPTKPAQLLDQQRGSR